MKMNNKHIVDCMALIVLLLVLIPCRAQASEESVVLEQKQDSLLYVLAKTNKANEKIEILHSLATLNLGKQDEVSYWKQVIDVASEVDSAHWCYRAMSSISKHYAIKKDIDSLVIWVNKLDIMGKEDRRAIEYQFQVYNYLCRVYMSGDEIQLESAMNIAISQRLLAEKTGNVKGLILSSENLGLIYMLSSRYKDAISNFETCLSLLNKENDQWAYKLQVAESLVRTYIYQSEFVKAKHLLDYYEDTLEKIETTMLSDSNYDSQYSRCFLYSYQIWMYSLQGEREKAAEALEELKPYKKALRGFVWAINKYAMGHYYFMIKKYDQALLEIKPIEEGDNEILQLKVDILKAKGDKKAVLETGRQLLDVYKKKNLKAYLSQVDQLRSLRQLNEREIQERALLTQEQELENQQTQLIFLIVFSGILAVLLIFLIQYSLRTRHLRNVLEREKIFLKETNCNLGIARDRAEKADRMKSNFIANISHEIRTPLNAIVGFTGLLADSSEEERTEYIQIINNNSDLLLNLVSDVLDLSWLEADNFKLNYEEVDLHACCQHALGTMRHRVNPGVKVIFTYSEAPYCVSTDSLRLQQLLVNLLTNAAKFTEEGEIRLDYKVDEMNKKVRFSVSDTGCGIPLDKQQIIFNRFEKVNDFKQGAGLGLSICKAVSDRLGGEILIDASYTDGACFLFILPLSKEQ